MKDKKEWIFNKKSLTISIILTVLIFFYILIAIYNIFVVKKYENTVLPNTYLQDYAIGDYSYDSLEEFITFLNGIVNDKKITFLVDGKEYSYKYSDVGLQLNSKKIVEEIEKYQNDMSYDDKLNTIYKGKKHVFSYSFQYDPNTLKLFLENLKKEVDCVKLDGHFVDDGYTVSYQNGMNGFLLNVDASYDTISKYLENPITSDVKIELTGDVDQAFTNESYSTVNTLVSSFTTEFDQYIYARATNLYTALNYINGAVIEPGEIFSYFKYAGPYNKKGYVFYYEFVGNGVCQIATTTYNAALLGGLEIVKRYPHAAKSVYVDGGLDATVASYVGWNVDFQFRNTYDYPIYVKAYANNGKATVELWSNKDAKKGYTYQTESRKIGYLGYETYLHVFKDGQEVDVRFIDRTWYSKQ